MKRHSQAAALTLTAALLTACAHQPVQVEAQTLNVRSAIATERPNAVPTPEESVAPVTSPEALTTDLLSLTSAPAQEERINIEVTSRPAPLFFADLGEAYGVNILVEPGVTDLITLSLKNVTLGQITSALRDLYGFDFTKTSYGYRVAPNQLSTRVYKLNYLNLERSGSTKTSVGGDDTNTVTTNFSASSTNSDAGFWNGIKQSLAGFISEDNGVSEPVIINSQTGLVVIHATGKEHAAIAKFLRDAELTMQKQVIIEAKIVEVTLDHQYRSGINWSFIESGFAGNSSSLTTNVAGDTLTGIGDVGGIFNLSLNLDNFTSMLQMLDHQGEVQVLSSPRVSTVNNQKAVIKVGADEYFATVNSVATDDEGGAEPTLELEQFFSGIALDVTPQIADDNSVTLHVRPTVTEVTERTKVINISGQAYSLPLAYSNIRESDSIIRAESGQIVVIGGLLQQKQDKGSTGLPWISKVPVIRSLFAQDRDDLEKSELVILLKPTVYDDYTTLNDIDGVLQRMN